MVANVASCRSTQKGLGHAITGLKGSTVDSTAVNLHLAFYTDPFQIKLNGIDIPTVYFNSEVLHL